jgi:bacterioferritin-associated ferredoxin
METNNLNFYKISKVYGDPSSNKFIRLYLDLDKQDRLIAFNFLHQGFDKLEDSLTHLRKQILGKKIDEVRELSFADSSFINIPALLFLDLIEDYKGGKTPNEDNLICRCFGIGSNQIKKILKGNPDASVLDITDQTNAGGGCTSCTKEIETIVESFKTAPGPLFVGAAKRYMGMTPADFLLKVDDSLGQVFGEDVKIVKLRDNYLLLKRATQTKEEIKNYLDRDFAPHFPLELLLV